MRSELELVMHQVMQPFSWNHWSGMALLQASQTTRADMTSHLLWYLLIM
jgi:hypothetical protein